MRPGTDEVHVDRLLTNMSIGYKNDMYIAQEIFPVCPVTNQSGIVPRYDKSAWFRNPAKKLGAMEAPPHGEFTVDNTLKYYAEEWGIAFPVPDRTRANTDAPYNLDRDGMMWLVDRIDMSREMDFISNYWKTGVWTTDWVGGTNFTKWSLFATSTPIVDVRSAKRTVRRLIARPPNVITLGDLVWDVVQDHPDFLDRIKFGSSSAAPAIVTKNLCAQVWELESVLVGTSIYTADPPGVAEASVTYTAAWDDDALLLFRPSSPSLFTPSAGYQFNWTTVWGGQRFIRRRREPLAEKGDLLEAFEFYHQMQTAADAGLFLSDVAD